MSSSNSWSFFLEEILASETKHYLWLRALSYLEYIGYRKMVKAVPYTEVGQGVYHHLTDEIQHSFMLKEFAEKNFENQRLTEKKFEGLKNVAEEYFQAVDSKMDETVASSCGNKDPYLCYMGVSYLIEKRAMKIYPSYFAKLTESPLKKVIQKIIKDESEHLAYLEDLIHRVPEASLLQNPSLLEDEEKCFGKFLEKMEKCFNA